MILRNVVIADQVLHLGAERRDAVFSDASMTTSEGMGIENVPVKAPLELDEVLAWIDSQGIEAREIIAKTLAEDLTLLRQRAVAEGYQSGSAAAREKIESEFKTALAALSQTAAETERQFNQHLEELECRTAEIVGQALTKLVGPALLDPQATRHAVRMVLERVVGARSVTLLLNKHDVEHVTRHLDELASAFGHRDISIKEDASIKSGGCIVECNLGEADARWDIQLMHLVNTLRELG